MDKDDKSRLKDIADDVHLIAYPTDEGEKGLQKRKAYEIVGLGASIAGIIALVLQVLGMFL
ncbi:MAG: hypothetical protein LBM77_10110 [Spirochaetaceae bacterium]|jgi:hypothetical protein|nr:hypothetical protein [Spirochaetaceae bacterium]